jgi:hypothetical protein
MTNDDDAPLYPLIGYTAGVVDGMIGLELEMATCREEYDKRSGSVLGVVMTPENAIEIGRELIRRGELAKPSAHLV